MDYIPRNELIEIIVRNNMVEEFISWVKNVKGDIPDPISLWDVDYELLLRFVLSKKLVELNDEESGVVDMEDNLGVEGRFTHIEKKTVPRKIRRKT